MVRIFLIGLTFFLTSCSLPGTQEESALVDESTIAWDSTVASMRIPKTWVERTGSGLPDAKK
jgi:hypothetical protein